MPHAYTEDQLVEQPAIGLFAELGWSAVSALEETFGVTGTLSRETKGDVVLVARLRAALERLKPALPSEAIAAAISGTLSLEPPKHELNEMDWKAALPLDKKRLTCSICRRSRTRRAAATRYSG